MAVKFKLEISFDVRMNALLKAANLLTNSISPPWSVNVDTSKTEFENCSKIRLICDL